MALSGFFAKRNISNLDIDIQIPDEVFAKRKTLIKVTIRDNKKFLPAFLIKARVEQEEILYPFIDPRGELSRYINIAFPSRGVFDIRDVYICSAYPFNFFMRCIKIKIEKKVIVLPEPKPCNYFEYISETIRKRGEEQTDERGYDGDLLSLRNYRPGDPLKYIHWKASAKTGQYMTKELSSLVDVPVVIDLERSGSSDVEERLSCAAYLIIRYFRMGIPFKVKIKGKIFDISGAEGFQPYKKKELLRELAIY